MKKSKTTELLLIYFYSINKMNIDLSKIVSICGLKPEGVEYVDPGNDPNFVFKNDVNFNPLTLFDIEGNVVIVNSWVECAHYINGGWSPNLSSFFQGDKYLFFLLLTVSLLYATYLKFFNLNKIKNEK